MASRLSEEALRDVYDRGLAVVAEPLSGALLGGAEPTRLVEALMNSADLGAAVAAVDPYEMYVTLSALGPEEYLELVPHLTREQVVKVFDYEAWDKDRLTLTSAFRWLDIFRSVSKEVLFTKFTDLDEEVQLALLGPHVEYIDEESYEMLSQEQQDTYVQLPCRTAWYRVRSEDPNIRPLIEDLIEGGMGANVAYVYSLLSHAAYVPPSEQEELARQFREARMEEDGFVSWAEAQYLFQFWSGAAPMAKRYGWESLESILNAQDVDVSNKATAGNGLVRSTRSRGRKVDFLTQVLTNLRLETQKHGGPDVNDLVQRTIHLANSVCAAVRITPDQRAAVEMILSRTRGLISLALDVLSGADLDKASAILVKEHPAELFRFAMALADELRAMTIRSLVAAGIRGGDKIERMWRLRRFGALLHYFDVALLPVIGFEGTEVLKGVFNRFPARAVPAAHLPDGERRVVFEGLTRHEDLIVLVQELRVLDSPAAYNWSTLQ